MIFEGRGDFIVELRLHRAGLKFRGIDKNRKEREK
jgi:hypothetical protein